MFTILGIILEILILSLFRIDDDFFSVFFILIICILYVIDTLRKKENIKISLILISGLLLRVFFLFFDIYGKGIYVLPSSGADSEYFYHQAVIYSENLNYKTVEFSEFIGIFMKFIGTSRLYIQFILTMFGVATINIMKKTCTILKLDFKYKLILMLLAAFLPNYAITSALFLRESLPTMFIAISILQIIKWLNSNKSMYILLAFIADLFATYFHSGCIALSFAYIIILLLYNNKSKKFIISLKSIILSFSFIIVFTFLYLNYQDVFFNKMMRVTSIKEIAATGTSGGSNYAQFVGNSDSFFNFIIYSPLRIFYFAFSPFIWQWRGISDIIAFVFNALIAIITFLLSIKSMKLKGKYHNLIIILLICWMCAFLVFGWGVTTTGTAIRHRDKFISIELLLLVSSLNTINEYSLSHKKIKSIIT